MWRVPVFFCACGGRVPVFWFWGCFFVRVVSLIENMYLFGAKRCATYARRYLLSSPRKISNFRSSILPFPITHEMWFFSILLLLLFVVCCRCRCLLLVLLLFLLLCCNFIFLTFLAKTNTFSFAKITRAQKKTGHTTRIKKKNLQYY